MGPVRCNWRQDIEFGLYFIVFGWDGVGYGGVSSKQNTQTNVRHNNRGVLWITLLKYCSGSGSGTLILIGPLKSPHCQWNEPRPPNLPYLEIANSQSK